jgi:hypothetical protein
MRAFADTNRLRLSEALTATEADLNRLRLMVQPFFLTMSAVALLVIALSLIASWLWASSLIERAQRASLSGIGLQINQTTTGPVLTWDEHRLRLINCQSGNTKTPCLQIIHEP